MKNRYFNLIIISVLLSSFMLISCNKEKKQKELLMGGYTLEYASIDGENVTEYLLNDTVNFHSLLIGEEEGVILFYIYFYPNDDRNSYYSSTCHFVDETSLSIYNKTIDEHMTTAVHNCSAFFPFSKQISFVLNIEALSEDQLILRTDYQGKTYRYKFKD